jgi:hypothetical protein
MSRRAVFLSEQVPGIRGLSTLTEPEPDDPVAGIVDVAVIGARGDGKTQFIVHAIRTLRAYGPAVVGAEQQHHRDVMKVVLDARAPRPDATAPGVVPHYVFRIRPAALVAGVGAAARLGLLGATTRLTGWLAGAAAVGAVVGAGAAGLGVGGELAALGALATAGAGAAAAARSATSRFARGAEIEVVFWDVAGEHVYSSSAADYHAFLDALVRERRRRAAGRRYAFAPVLVCNPLGLGVDRDGSAYHRLRQVTPLFASLDAAARVLVAVNRWSLVAALCEPDRDRDEVVTVVERDGAEPVRLRRDVVRAWCRDAEDGRDDDVVITHLRYDAGARCQVAAVDGDAAPALEYRWQDAPGSFTGAARRAFLGWLGDLAYRAPAGVAAADAPLALPALGEAAPVPAEVWARRGRAQES